MTISLLETIISVVKNEGATKKTKVTGAAKKFAEKLDRELPYVITLITIMAASGITPFGSFTKLARYSILPSIMKEARNIIGQVKILGEDPLTAMEKRAHGSASKQYKDLLLGYVSTVRNGGDVTNFLQSKMKSIFEYETSVSKQSVAKVGGLVDAYMIMQVVALSLYVVMIALSSMPSTGNIMPASMTSPIFSYLLVFVMLPGISIAILYALDKTVPGYLIGASEILKKGVIYSVSALGAFAVLTMFGIIQMVMDPVYALPIFLAAASARPAYQAIMAERNMRAMESELPGYLRDIAESRKAGLSPERCIIYASERLRDITFQKTVKGLANQLEWGVPLRKIYEYLAVTVKSWITLIHFRILIEAIESGGGYTTSLDILAQASESAYNTDREKKSLLKPYFLIAFMVTALTSISSLMVAETFVGLNESVIAGEPQVVSSESSAGAVSPTQMFSIGIAAQSWMTGFLMGKISSGSFATGFKYGIMLMLISTLAIIGVQEFNIGPGSLMGSPEIQTPPT